MTIPTLFDRVLAGSRRDRTPASASLDGLDLVAIDSETTGLDVREARIVSFAAIRIAPGLAVCEPPMVDMLVDPGIPIPAASTAIHGIDTRRVTGAPTIAEAWDEIDAVLAGRLVVGHNVAFDFAVLSAEARRIGRRWREPASLDTASMLAGLGHPVDRLDLEALLPRLDLAPRGGRHTAAGDALMAADLFVAIARQLQRQGRATLGGAVGLQRTPRR